MMNIKWLPALLLTFAAGHASASDTLRCGSQLVSLGDRASEVLQKCGEPISREELARIKSECASFHKQERAKSGAVVKPIDHWTKDGHIVVELSEKASEDASKYTSHLCVYDKDKGSIALPSVFERSRWAK